MNVIPLTPGDMFRAVATADNTAYVLSSDLRIVCTNEGWERFARANEGERVLADWRPGRSVVDAICEELRPFYVEGFARTRESGRPWEHDYECSTPGRFRLFRMIAYPTYDGFVVTHALRIARPHDRAECSPADVYAAHGVVTMCAHCRRVRHPSFANRWDWVPGYVQAMPEGTTHSLCPACKRYYYGAVSSATTAPPA